MANRLFAAFAAIFAFLPLATARDITAGVAITDSDTMQELETHGFALSSLFSPSWKLGVKTRVKNNAEFVNAGPISAIRDVVRDEFKKYEEGFLERFPDARGSYGTGIDPNFRKFERHYLISSSARFDLVGVINRMDRAYRSPETCGEIRFIYRLAYKARAKEINNEFRRLGHVYSESRLPMTINLVLRARNTPSPNEPEKVSCQELAKRWLKTGDTPLKGRELAQALMATGGALEFVEPAQIDRMETNIQVIRVPATIIKAFGGNAEYLLNIFNWNPGTKSFTRKKLENQIDRADLVKNPGKLAALKKWLFTPERLYQLAEGTITIPEEYLAFRTITSAPGGTARANNRPFLGLISDAEADAAFKRLKDAAAQLDPDGVLRNIDSGFGLQQRLTDITCTGCHQSRAIGGFHFMGADWKSNLAALPQNSIFVAGSPHFYADLPRRRAVVEAFAAGTPPDYLRGFSMRPRVKGRGNKTVFSGEFASLRNGWGSNCYLTSGNDASFRDWNCQDGLVCKALHHSAFEPNMGICLNKARNGNELKIGDPFLFGELKADPDPLLPSNAARVINYKEDYCATSDILNQRIAQRGKCLTPGSSKKIDGKVDKQDAAYQGGGFFGGMHKIRGCKSPPESGTVCANEAGDFFSRCVGMLRDKESSFKACLTLSNYARNATLRSCNVMRPCRDDYLCLATKSTPADGLGACLPPYFLFQFRIDGHPTPPEGEAAQLVNPN